MAWAFEELIDEPGYGWFRERPDYAHTDREVADAIARKKAQLNDDGSPRWVFDHETADLVEFHPIPIMVNGRDLSGATHYRYRRIPGRAK